MESHFAKNLTRIRKAKGLTQEKLAQIAGVSRRAIAHYESGDSKSNVENIYAIAKALNIKIEELFNLPDQEEDEDVKIDGRTMEKIKMILALPRDKRHMIYTIVEALSNYQNNKE